MRFAMNIFFLSMSPEEAARWHANIHVVKMIVETAQLLCNVHHRAAEKASHCLPPYTRKARIPYKDSRSGHRKLGSMIWVAESLGNYRWGVRLGLALCREYNKGRGRAEGRREQHRTQAVLEWLRDHEPRFQRTKRTPVRAQHLAMPDKFKKAPSAVDAYRDYYFSKRRTMPMAWPEGRVPEWWETRLAAKRSRKRKMPVGGADSGAIAAPEPPLKRKTSVGAKGTAPVPSRRMTPKPISKRARKPIRPLKRKDV